MHTAKPVMKTNAITSGILFTIFLMIITIVFPGIWVFIGMLAIYALSKELIPHFDRWLGLAFYVVIAWGFVWIIYHLIFGGPVYVAI